MARRLGRSRCLSAPARRLRPPASRNTTCWRCSPIRRGASTWATPATMRWATWWRASSAPAASTCCTRWAGTPSACRPRTPPWRRGVHPKAWTYSNIDNMRAQLKLLGLSIDWSREFATCDPGYYGRQQQWFLKLWKQGLVYRKEGVVNWDPVDQTVLANEQVIDGRGWRSGALVEKRKLTQWFLRITEYADDLVEALKGLDRWPDKVRLMQENWIGKSRGPEVPLRLRGPCAGSGFEEGLEVYTTRPDTLFGASFVAPRARPSAGRAPGGRRSRRSPPSSPNAAGAAPPRPRSRPRRRWASTPAWRSPHPFDPNWRLPVWIANFVLMRLRHGRDFRLPGARPARPGFRPQVRPAGPAGRAAAGRRPRDLDARGRGLYRARARCSIREFLDGLDTEAAKAKAIDRIEAQGQGEGAIGLPPARLGRVAPALLGLPDPGGPLRGLRRDGRARRPAAGRPAGRRELRRPRQPAAAAPDLEAHDLPQLRRAGRAGDRHARHLRRQLLVLRPLRRPHGRSRRSTRRRPTTGCRSTSTSAASSTRSCTCSMRASSPALWPTAATCRCASRSPACSPRAW